jgi:hypothetical protein
MWRKLKNQDINHSYRISKYIYIYIHHHIYIYILYCLILATVIPYVTSSPVSSTIFFGVRYISTVISTIFSAMK